METSLLQIITKLITTTSHTSLTQTSAYRFSGNKFAAAAATPRSWRRDAIPGGRGRTRSKCCLKYTPDCKRYSAFLYYILSLFFVSYNVISSWETCDELRLALRFDENKIFLIFANHLLEQEFNYVKLNWS
jgi:hypothetical protein